MRFGVTVVAAAGFVVALAANIATSMGHGPFSAGSGSFDVVTLQIFLAIALVASFVAAAMTSELANRDEVHRLLTQEATHDALTGLPNRLLFTERLNRALLDRDAAARPIAVVLIDLDDFKKVNDRYGHPAGDAALAIVADSLRAAARPQDLLARLGGDEFVILCDNPTSCDEVIRIAGDVSQTLDRPIAVDGVEHRLPASTASRSSTPTSRSRRPTSCAGWTSPCTAASAPTAPGSRCSTMRSRRRHDDEQRWTRSFVGRSSAARCTCSTSPSCTC
jgi:diguanylate cyclase (GGDEF)-like protein